MKGNARGIYWSIKRNMTEDMRYVVPLIVFTSMEVSVRVEMNRTKFIHLCELRKSIEEYYSKGLYSEVEVNRLAFVLENNLLRYKN